MDRVIIFGNGQTASLTAYYLTHDSPYQVVAFTTDEARLSEPTHLGLPVVPFENIEASHPPDAFKMTVQASFRRLNHLRAEKYRQAKAKGYELINYVSSRASVWPELRLGDNCFIFEQCIIQPFAELGNDVVAAPGCTISHHARVRDHCFLAPNTVLLGNTTVEPYCLVGANATVVEKVTIARACIVGAGTVIRHDTEERGVYNGNPAKKLPIDSEKWLTWPLLAS